MSDALIAAVQQSQLKSDVPRIDVGDNVDVHVRIVEGSKERVQVFTGVVIADKGGGLERTIKVRRIVANEGVERTFPVHSPRVDKIEVVRHGDSRRAKLYFLRDRVGKKRRLRDRRRGVSYLDGKASDLLEVKSRQRREAREAAAAAASSDS